MCRSEPKAALSNGECGKPECLPDVVLDEVRIGVENFSSGRAFGYHPGDGCHADGQATNTWDATARKGMKAPAGLNPRSMGYGWIYRHGYSAQPDPVLYDRERAIADARIFAAGRFARSIQDTPLKLSASVGARHAGKSEVRVELVIDSSKVTFKPDGEFQATAMDVALFVLDRRTSCQVRSDDRTH